jgi:hypothetical protein
MVHDVHSDIVSLGAVVGGSVMKDQVGKESKLIASTEEANMLHNDGSTSPVTRATT